MQTEMFTAFAQHAEQALGRRSILKLVAGGALLGAAALLPLPALADKKARQKRRAERRQRRNDTKICNGQKRAVGADDRCEDDS